MDRLLKISTLILIIYYIISAPAINKDLDKKLFQVRKSVNNINYGGCGFMALYTAEYFERINISHQIIMLRIESVGFTHFMVKVKDSYIDANGFWSRYYPLIFICKEIPFSQEMLRKRLSNQKIWNTSFKRSDTILIKNILK